MAPKPPKKSAPMESKQQKAAELKPGPAGSIARRMEPPKPAKKKP